MNQSFLTFLQTLGECRKLLSQIKISLVHSQGFQLGHLYSQIDQSNSGKISPNDLYLYLFKKQIRTTESQMFSVFKELDRKKAGEITANDLSDYFSQNSLFSAFTRSEEKYNESMVMRFFDQIIENNKRLERCRVELSKYSVEGLFEVLDSNKGGILTLEDVRCFMQSNGCEQEIIMEVYYYLSERGIVVISPEQFQSLVEPFEKPPSPSYPVQTPTFNQISSSKNIWEKQSPDGPCEQSQEQPNSFQSTIQKLSLVSDSPFDINQFLSKKVEQNKTRRQYIQDHQKKREEYVEEMMKRRSRPNSSLSSIRPIKTQFSEIGLMSSVASPRNLLLTAKLDQSLSKISSYKRNVKDIEEELKQKLKSLRREESSATSPDISFTLSQTFSKPNLSTDYNSLLLQQQKELQLQRSRRIQAEKEVMNYKRQLQQLSTKMHSPSSLFKPLSANISPKIGHINKNYQSPKYSGFWNQENGYTRSMKYQSVEERIQNKLREKGREKEKEKSRQYGESIKGHADYELMRSKLDLEFNNYKRMKEINSGLHLYR